MGKTKFFERQWKDTPQGDISRYWNSCLKCDLCNQVIILINTYAVETLQCNVSTKKNHVNQFNHKKSQFRQFEICKLATCRLYYF